MRDLSGSWVLMEWLRAVYRRKTDEPLKFAVFGHQKICSRQLSDSTAQVVLRIGITTRNAETRRRSVTGPISFWGMLSNADGNHHLGARDRTFTAKPGKLRV